jgi:hypothetical protein
MVERRSELKRRRTRRKKMLKLKSRLATAKEGREKDTILQKIHVMSPWWKEPQSSSAPPPPPPTASPKKRSS